MSGIRTIALIGFGEVGQTVCDDLRRQPDLELRVWDTAFGEADSVPSRAARARRAIVVGGDQLGVPPLAIGGVIEARSAAEATRGADLIICAVTAAQTVEAARSVVGAAQPGAFFLDLNSASPRMKTEAAALVSWADVRYVEAAVMSPIHPRGIGSPMLPGGPDATAFLAASAALGFAGAQPYSDQIGKAAATKLCRSVIVKGIEALLTESLLAARRYGVERVVLDSLSDLLPLPDWNHTAQYMIARSVRHGARRAEEMREAAAAIEEAGMPATMSYAVAQRQDWVARHRSAFSPDLGPMLDAIIRDMKEGR